MSKKILGLAAAVGLLFTQGAVARTVPGLSGVAVPWSDTSCFVASNGSVRNNCTGKADFAIALPVDNEGAKTVSITASAVGPSTNVGCQAFGVDRTGSTVWASGAWWLSSFNSPLTMAMTGIYVPVGGTLYTQCYVGPGGRIYGVEYNQ